MPYFAWKGVDVHNKEHYGKAYARNQKELSNQLHQLHIKLVYCREPRISFIKKIDMRLLAHISENIAHLLDAGLTIDEALDLCAKTMNHATGMFVIKDSAEGIRQGIRLSFVLDEHKKVLDPVFIALTHAGEESGSLTKTFNALARHYKTQILLRKQLCSALITPLITILIFFLVTVAIFLVVIPRFESFFTMLHKPVPPITKSLFSISSFLRNRISVVNVLSLLLSLGIIYKCFAISQIKQIRDRMILQVPVVGKLIRFYYVTLFLQTLTVMLEGGVHLVKAIDVSHQIIGNDDIKETFKSVLYDVEGGMPLSKSIPLRIRGDVTYLQSLCEMGEVSGNLPTMINKASMLYFDWTYDLLRSITLLIPLLVLVITGILIALLIFAVYIPLFSLSHLL